MKARVLKYRDADENAQLAAIRATIYSDNCRMMWSAADRARAQSFIDCAQAAYTGVRKEPTFRKSWMAVKIEGMVRDRVMARMLDEIAADRGYEKVRTEQGLTYRLK
jgi:hypothetical protein